jgi:hypothetical protein
MIWKLIGYHYCEDAQGRDGHGHASESKETLYYKRNTGYFLNGHTFCF